MNIKVRYITKGKEYRRSEYQMKQILIATHGKMASGIRYTAELIVGKMAEITTIDAYVTPEDNVEKKFEEYFAQHENDRIFVFTDLMGGSVNQKLLRYSQKENVTLITGTNLPVLMQVMMADDDVTEEEIQEFIDDAREELQMVDLGGGKKSTSEKMLKKILHRVSKILRRFQKVLHRMQKNPHRKKLWLPSPMTIPQQRSPHFV